MSGRGCERCGKMNVALRPIFIGDDLGGKWTTCDPCAEFLRGYRDAKRAGRLATYLLEQKMPR